MLSSVRRLADARKEQNLKDVHLGARLEDVGVCAASLQTSTGDRLRLRLRLHLRLQGMLLEQHVCMREERSRQQRRPSLTSCMG